MLDKNTYKNDLVRMWDSVRTSNKGEHTCAGVSCEDCPLYDVNVCHSYSVVNAYYIYEEATKYIDFVEKWGKEHPLKKYKISKTEYDILMSVSEYKHNLSYTPNLFKFRHIKILMSMLKKGYFKGANEDMNIDEYINLCEVTDE